MAIEPVPCVMPLTARRPNEQALGGNWSPSNRCPPFNPLSKVHLPCRYEPSKDEPVPNEKGLLRSGSNSEFDCHSDPIYFILDRPTVKEEEEWRKKHPPLASSLNYSCKNLESLE